MCKVSVPLVVERRRRIEEGRLYPLWHIFGGNEGQGTASIAISHRAVRLRGLQRMAEKAEIQGNIVLAASLMKQAAEEVATPTPTGVSYGGMGRTCRYPYRRPRSSSYPTMKLTFSKSEIGGCGLKARCPNRAVRPYLSW
ncbi:uncharacterized protein DUF2280 [Sinorhizobium medicae]|nr:uncharacterized protein DUF2280 [Sinorhizobium medicae]